MKSQTKILVDLIDDEFKDYYAQNLKRFNERFPSVVLDGIEVGYASMLPEKIKSRLPQEN